MSNSTDAILQTAFDLIEQGEPEQAEIVLAPLLETENDSPALWWIYAHAVRDSQVGLAALERVLQLDPDYPGARELREQTALAQSAREVEQAAASAQTSDAAPGEIDDWEALQPQVEQAAQSSKLRKGLVAVAAVALLIAAGGLLVVSGELDITALSALIAPSPAPQVVVIAVPTETEPSLTPPPTETEMPPTATPTPVPTKTAVPVTSSPQTRAFISLAAVALANVEIDETHSGFRVTELGDTLVFQVCAVPGPQFQARLGVVMNAVASLAVDIPEDAEAIAVSLLNCADEDATPRVIGVERDTIQAYASEEIDSRDFQRSWQALS